MSAWPEIRQEAARALSNRPYDHFVPALLSSMFTPVSLSCHDRAVVPVAHSFIATASYAKRRTRISCWYWTPFIAVSRSPEAIATETAVRTVANAARDAMTREMEVARQNVTSTQVNAHIAHALSLATGQQVGFAASSLVELVASGE